MTDQGTKGMVGRSARPTSADTRVARASESRVHSSCWFASHGMRCTPVHLRLSDHAHPAAVHSAHTTLLLPLCCPCSHAMPLTASCAGGPSPVASTPRRATATSPTLHIPCHPSPTPSSSSSCPAFSSPHARIATARMRVSSCCSRYQTCCSHHSTAHPSPPLPRPPPLYRRLRHPSSLFPSPSRPLLPSPPHPRAPARGHRRPTSLSAC
jgi:hypothetical protein